MMPVEAWNSLVLPFEFSSSAVIATRTEPRWPAGQGAEPSCPQLKPSQISPHRPSPGMSELLAQPRSEKQSSQIQSKSPTCGLESEINTVDSHHAFGTIWYTAVCVVGD